MAIAIEGDVRKAITTEFEEKIHRAHMNAWRDWWDHSSRLDYSYWKRTRACLIFERLRFHLTEEFKGNPRARFSFANETFKLIIDNKFLIRFKKDSGKGMGSNILTQAVFNFCDSQMEIPGLPGIQKVEIVYALNITESAIASIVVVARDGRMKLWAYNIGAIGESAEIITMPQRPALTVTAKDLVKPREAKQKKKPENEK